MENVTEMAEMRKSPNRAIFLYVTQNQQNNGNSDLSTKPIDSQGYGYSNVMPHCRKATVHSSTVGFS